jgi:hypothetical protein
VTKWTLICPNCAYRFTHSNVEPRAVEESYRDPFRVVARPKFPDGETLTCPNCKGESVYEAFELIYDAEESGPTAMG